MPLSLYVKYNFFHINKQTFIHNYNITKNEFFKYILYFIYLIAPTKINKNYKNRCLKNVKRCLKNVLLYVIFNTFFCKYNYKMNAEKKWTNKQPYERSRRRTIEVDQTKMLEQSAYTSALNYDENTWDILNQSLSGAGFKISNKREDLEEKMSTRDLVQQRGANPFLSNNNYINDISISDQFLKPVNTTFEKEQTNTNTIAK